MFGLMREIWDHHYDIAVGAWNVSCIVLLGRRGGVRQSTQQMTPWEAHTCTASPGSIAHPIDESGNYIVEEFKQAD
jgi:hypothetical protein